MYKSNINIEKQLQKIAMENPEYRELWSTWNLNKQTLEPILNAIIKDYPHYSLHDYTHSESILLNIERLLGNDNIEKLSPTDLWLLLHVAYLHDFGMVILDTKIYEIWESASFQYYLNEQRESTDNDVKKAADTILGFNKGIEEYDVTWPLEVKRAITILISTYCRSRHAEMSKEYVLDVNNIWGIDLGHNGLIKKRLISLIGDIGAMHTKPFEEVMQLHKEANGFKNDYMHPRFIACMLRMGDVLDLDNGRFNKYGSEIFGEMPESSKWHLKKHEATKHVLITNELIEVEADCPDDETYRETRRWYDLLKNETNNLQLHWNDIAPVEFGRPSKLAPYKILRNGIEDSHELSDLKFSISQSKAFEILEGSAIYKDKFSCLREIIQNAEDASKIQMWRDIKGGMFYCPNGISEEKVKEGALLPNDIPSWIYEVYAIDIVVETNEKNNAVVSITDHGTGISIASLKALCNVGQSYFIKKETKQEIEEMPVWLRPTANFGIGLQSCFMATDKIVVYTNSNSDKELKIIFESGKGEGYVNVEKIQGSFPRGSKVVIEFDENLNFSYDIMGFTAKKLSEIDPFKSNCIVMYKIIESIFKDCNSSFFNINVLAREIDFKETIMSYFSETEHKNSNFITYNDCLYYLRNNNKAITIWYHDNFYKIELNKNCRGNVEIMYKGKTVSKNKILSHIYVGIDIMVDIYGIPTKKALSLNREELSSYASQIIRQDLKYLIKMYFDLLAGKASDIEDDTDLVDVYLLTSWIYEKTFPRELLGKVSSQENIRVLQYNIQKQEYESSYISLREIAEEYPELPYINTDTYHFEVTLPKSQKVQKLKAILNRSNIDKSLYKYIITDELLINYLRIGFHYTNYIEGADECCIYTVDISNELYSPNNYTRKKFMKNLVYNQGDGIHYNSMFIMRRAIPAFKEYEKLAVSLNGIFGIGRDDQSKWYIISPISLADAKLIKEMSKETFCDYIVSQQVFDNLVEYVVKNAKCSVNPKECIITEYKQLIEEYYDFAIKEMETSENIR